MAYLRIVSGPIKRTKTPKKHDLSDQSASDRFIAAPSPLTAPTKQPMPYFYSSEKDRSGALAGPRSELCMSSQDPTSLSGLTVQPLTMASSLLCAAKASFLNLFISR